MQILGMKKVIPRILMINDHIHFGGGGDAVFRLERSCYENAGLKVFTFSQAVDRPQFPSDRDFVAMESKCGLLRKAGKFLFSPRISRSLRKALQSVRPHFVSVHLVSKYPLSIYPQLGGYPVVQTLHGTNLFCATSWGCLRDSTSCELGIGLKCFTRGCASLEETAAYMFLQRRLLHAVRSNVDLFVCPSEHLRKAAEAMGFTPAEFMPLGIDDEFKAQPNFLREGPPTVLYVGTLAEQKGVHILLEAFRSVLTRVPKAQLVIAGRGSMLESLRRKAADNGLANSVNFLGFVGHSEMGNLYRQATVLAVPSIWKEQFGLIGPEALACGVPCVGSDFGGIPEWLHDGEWGFTVPPRDPTALANRIVTILENPDLRLKFGTRGRAWALRQYSADKYRQNRLRLLEQYARNAPAINKSGNATPREPRDSEH